MSETIPQAEPKYTCKKIEAELTSKAWRDSTFLEELCINPKAVIAKEYGVQFPTVSSLKSWKKRLILFISVSPQPQ